MKTRNLRIAVLFFGAALFTGVLFQNCSPVAFTAEEPSSAVVVKGSEETALCDDGQVAGSIRWDLVSGQNIEEPGKCDFGGDLTLIFEKNQKLVCESGKYVGSGDFKKGNLVGQKGGCNCADGVSNGMSTWKVITGQNMTESQACPANGTLSLVYEKLQKYTCDNGKLVSSEDYQKGKLVRQDGACKCADGSAEGSSVYKLVLNATITEPGICTYGGNLQYNYEKKQKFTCMASQLVASNDFMKGLLLSTTGACSCEGGILSGGSKLVILAGQTISEPATTCKYGGTLVNVYQKLEKNLCTSGSYSSTGQYSKGSFIRQDGACNPPPILTELLSITSTTTTTPMDMIWVVDNSGSMSEEAANVRKNLTNFINSLDLASDLKFLLLSQQGTTGTTVSLPAGLDVNRFKQINIAVGSTNGPKLLLNQLTVAPFFRPDSKKVIVFVTDDNSALSAADFTTGLTSLGMDAGKASVFGFIGLGAVESKCQFATGTVYQSLATQTNAKVYNICDLDWTQNFSALKAEVLIKVGRTFTLKDILAAKIAKVEVDGVVISTSMYSFINGVLTLSDQVVMTAQSTVKVYYTQE